MNKQNLMKNILTLAFGILTVTPVLAQSGGASALSNAATDISNYMGSLKTLIYAIGAIVGVVGGLRIYNKWSNGDQDINKEVVGWGGACIFLLLVPTFISAIF
jgi:hypothetical protein